MNAGTHPVILGPRVRELAGPLVGWYDKSLNDVELPEVGKNLQLVTIHRVDAKDDATNYKPIAVLSAVIKPFR